MNTVRQLSILFLAATCTFFYGGVSAKTLVFATSYDEGSHHTINHRVFSRELQRETFGDIELELHTNASLYQGMELLDAASSGQIDMGELILSALEPIDPIFLLDNLPFLVSDFEESRELWNLTKPAIESHLSERGLKLLYSTPWPPQGLYGNVIPNSISDFASINIRTYSEMTRRLIEAMGSTPIAVPFNEVQTAFQNNRIDAMITSVSTGMASSAWQFTDVYTDVVLWIPKNIVFINVDSYNNLTETEQTILDSLSVEAEERGWRLAREEYYRSLVSLSDNGLKIRSPSPTLINELEAAGNAVIQNWLQDGNQAAEPFITQMK